MPTFALRDPATGETFDSQTLKGSDSLVIFLRGTWCPYCREQLALLSQRYSEIRSAGISVVAISCQSEGSIARHLSAHPLPFPLLADERRTAARAFGVHYTFRWDGMNLARPSLFISDAAGIVTFRHVGRNMTDLPVQMILEKFLTLLSPARTLGSVAP